MESTVTITESFIIIIINTSSCMRDKTVWKTFSSETGPNQILSTCERVIHIWKKQTIAKYSSTFVKSR